MVLSKYLKIFVFPPFIKSFSSDRSIFLVNPSNYKWTETHTKISLITTKQETWSHFWERHFCITAEHSRKSHALQPAAGAQTGEEDSLASWVLPDTGGSEENCPHSWFWTSPTLDVVAIWGLDQQEEVFSLPPFKHTHMWLKKKIFFKSTCFQDIKIKKFLLK